MAVSTDDNTPQSSLSSQTGSEAAAAAHRAATILQVRRPRVLFVQTIAACSHPCVASCCSQAAERGRVARRYARRRKEIGAWMAVKAERSVLLAFMYLAVSMYIAALIWMNLLYGVKLSQDVAAGWVKAGFVSFLVSAFVTSNLVLAMKGVLALIMALTRKRKVHTKRAVAAQAEPVNETVIVHDAWMVADPTAGLTDAELSEEQRRQVHPHHAHAGYSSMTMGNRSLMVTDSAVNAAHGGARPVHERVRPRQRLGRHAPSSDDSSDSDASVYTVEEDTCLDTRPRKKYSVAPRRSPVRAVEVVSLDGTPVGAVTGSVDARWGDGLEEEDCKAHDARGDATTAPGALDGSRLMSFSDSFGDDDGTALLDSNEAKPFGP